MVLTSKCARDLEGACMEVGGVQRKVAGRLGKSKGCTWATGWARGISEAYVVPMQRTHKEEALLEVLCGSATPGQGIRQSATSEALSIWYVPLSVI